ncbi:MAG: hypothetical protein ACREX6_11370, partial [Casimicrobiaceae bacterium]
MLATGYATATQQAALVPDKRRDATAQQHAQQERDRDATAALSDAGQVLRAATATNDPPTREWRVTYPRTGAVMTILFCPPATRVDV